MPRGRGDDTTTMMFVRSVQYSITSELLLLIILHTLTLLWSWRILATVATTVTLAISCPSSRSSPVHLLADLFYEIWVLGLHLLRQLPPSGNKNCFQFLYFFFYRLLWNHTTLRFVTTHYPPFVFYTSMYKLFSFPFPLLHFSITFFPIIYQSNPIVACLHYSVK